ncbi:MULTISPECIES: xylulokinase [unclassified Lentimonas]|uniref:xylulokinase n=1 Tax=unclassified Lentimonas TaxID=2630993 RepID=UPI0013239525|nr:MULTISPECIES: FGGY family carbohydrate kinase [unclassified Lentimonas]CAA6692347.1 Xylulose kinase (EC [Lentimonas sp. CC10]CAA6694683.1 Xylulose kinase (EC [Lentimonas sp. CC19]CAA7071429.1 Xylulose kinase (EC [Lentimonas sp. CC11]
MSYALGLDSSTQSCSALIIDVALGTVVAEASVNFGAQLPQYNAPSGFIPDGENGEVHSDPLMWLDALEMLLKELAAQCDLSKVTAISGAGQQHGSVYLNDQWFYEIDSLTTDQALSQQLAKTLARKTSPIWMDGSTGEECREIANVVGGDTVVCAKSGSIAIERFTGPQIRRFYKNDAAAYEQTDRIHLVSSFLCSVLIGDDAPIDTGDGAGMNLVNIDAWDWDTDLLEATAPELLKKLPPVAQGNTVAGTLSSYFTKKYGFATGVPVTIFTGDNPSSLVGMGASQPGKVVISLGTSDTFFAAMPNVVADPTGSGHVFGNPSAGSMSLQCFINGSLAREAVKDKFNYDWDQFSQAFANTPLGNDGNLMVPFFRPEISPRIELEAPILKGSSSFENWVDADAAIRACVEGQFLNMKLRTDWMQLQPEVIYLTGGASKNNAIAQVIADIFDAKVQRLAVSGSVALGAAMRAASNSLGKSISELENTFCQPEADSTIEPQADGTIYSNAAEAFDALI